ncbi:MAG: hypothetical protein LBH20_03010 [Treponema sp.]|jgi:hypothetical protein|nr:hypothetical protein [Treponema sp.]
MYKKPVNAMAFLGKRIGGSHQFFLYKRFRTPQRLPLLVCAMVRVGGFYLRVRTAGTQFLLIDGVTELI